MQRFLSNLALVVIILAAFFARSTPAVADWDPNNPADLAKAKWIQLPDTQPTGMDILATFNPFSPAPQQWKLLADDFLCNQTGPITDVHLWGSWLNDVLPTNPQTGGADPGQLKFKLSFHDDVPVDATNPFSHPGNLLWQGVFSPGQFKVNPIVIPSQEHFFDPNLGQDIGQDHGIFQYNFTNLVDSTGNPFVQTKGNIYWLDVQVEVQNTLGTVPAVFGWKTADHSNGQHNLDDAVFADTTGFGTTPGPWRDLHYPSGHPFSPDSLDMAFVLTVPEPRAIGMAAMGLAALAAVAYRRRRVCVA